MSSPSNRPAEKKSQRLLNAPIEKPSRAVACWDVFATTLLRARNSSRGVVAESALRHSVIGCASGRQAPHRHIRGSLPSIDARSAKNGVQMYQRLLAAGVLVLASSYSHEASAVSQKLKDACRSDYHAYCGEHAVGSQPLRDCMADAFDKLSEPCVAAILDSEFQKDNARPHKRARHYAHHRHDGKNWVSHVKHGTRVAKRFMARVSSRARHFMR